MEQIVVLHISTEELKEIIREVFDEKGHRSQSVDERDTLLSISEACKVFRPAITRQTLNNWRRMGLVNAIDIGKSRRYKLSDLLSARGNINRYERKTVPTKNLRFLK